MTLVEVVVFMTLTLSVFGGLIPAAMQANRLDYATEERISAFFSCKSNLEDLKQVAFKDLTDSGSGFVQQPGFGGNLYTRVQNGIPFHTRGGMHHTQITASERTDLLYDPTGGSSYKAVITMEWTSSQGRDLSETVSTILYP